MAIVNNMIVPDQKKVPGFIFLEFSEAAIHRCS